MCTKRSHVVLIILLLYLHGLSALFCDCELHISGLGVLNCHYTEGCTATKLEYVSEIRTLRVVDENLTILNNNTISTLTKELPRVQHVDFSRNKIIKIENSAFSDKLKSLNLSSNMMFEFPNISAYGLLQLDISRNYMDMEDYSMTSRFPMLKYLDVSFNTRLHLDSFILNENLVTFKASHTSIKGLTIFSSTPRLRNLILSYANIATLGESTFRGCPDLVHVDLSGNGLSSVPSNLFATNLKLLHLDLSKNLLTIVPSDFGLNCELYKREESSPACSLRSLNLSHNKLERLVVATFENFPSLTHLDVNDNQISHIDSATFAEQRNLKSLNLNGNKLTELSSELFRNNQELKVLQLARNELKDMNVHLLNALNLLNLHRNKLTNLPESINSLTNLNTLVISCNNFIFFPPESITAIRDDLEIIGYGNPWKCPCLDNMLNYFPSWITFNSRLIFDGSSVSCIVTDSQKCDTKPIPKDLLEKWSKLTEDICLQ